MATKKTTPKTSTKKTADKKPRSSRPSKSIKTGAIAAAASTPSTPASPSRFNLSTNNLIVIAIVVLLGITIFLTAQHYRGLVIAAIVNKTPITRWELNQALTSRYGDAVLEELIARELLTQEAAKVGITITDEEISAERQSLVDSLGGESNLTDTLAQYNLTEADLTDQLRFGLIQERLAAELFNIVVTDEQVEEHFNTNKSMYEGRKFDDVREGIKENLSQQQLQQEFNTWFDQLKSSSQIEIYIK